MKEKNHYVVLENYIEKQTFSGATTKSYLQALKKYLGIRTIKYLPKEAFHRQFKTTKVIEILIEDNRPDSIFRATPIPTRYVVEKTSTGYYYTVVPDDDWFEYYDRDIRRAQKLKNTKANLGEGISNGKWVKTTEDGDFIQWIFEWKEDGSEVLGTEVTVRDELGTWNLYVDSMYNKSPITKHISSKTKGLELAKDFMNKHPKGY